MHKAGIRKNDKRIKEKNNSEGKRNIFTRRNEKKQKTKTKLRTKKNR